MHADLAAAAAVASVRVRLAAGSAGPAATPRGRPAAGAAGPLRPSSAQSVARQSHQGVAAAEPLAAQHTAQHAAYMLHVAYHKM